MSKKATFVITGFWAVITNLDPPDEIDGETALVRPW